MWSSAKALALLALLVVAGCGFQPMYGGRQGAQVSAQMASISVARIADRSGQQLRNALEHRLFRSGVERDRYRLVIQLSEGIEELGVRKNLTATRANIRIRAQWRLEEGDQTLRTGETEAISAYNILDEQYATVMSQKDARERAIDQLADEIVRQLAVTFTRAQ